MMARLLPLGEIAEIVMGQSPPGATYNRNRSGSPLLNGPAEFGERYPIAVQWTTEPSRFAEAGDILFCVRGATTGRKCWADQQYAIGRGLAAIRGRPAQCDTQFLWFLLDFVTDALLSRAAGSTFINLPGEQLLNFKVPLRPLAEQERVAAHLTAAMASADAARRAAEERLAAAEALPAAYLREVFEGPEAAGWERKPLRDVAEIVSGITLGRRAELDNTRRVPYLRVANVKDGYLDLSDVYDIAATESEIEELALKHGDLLLTEGGDRDKLGRGTCWEDQLPLCLHQNHIFRVRLNAVYDPRFVSLQVGSTYGKNYFLSHAKQTTGIATINQGVLGNLPLLSPSLETQRRMVATLCERLSAAEALVARCREELAAIEALPAALLREAFGGSSSPSEV